MTPSQLIHLARVAGLKGVYKDIYGDVVRLHTREPYIPHTPEGAAQFRELWVALPLLNQEGVRDRWYKKHPPFQMTGYDINFVNWLFTCPAEACRAIYEVTGGEEK